MRFTLVAAVIYSVIITSVGGYLMWLTTQALLKYLGE